MYNLVFSSLPCTTTMKVMDYRAENSTNFIGKLNFLSLFNLIFLLFLKLFLLILTLFCTATRQSEGHNSGNEQKG